MLPRLDHVEFTVTDLPRAESFYDAFLPLLGFDLAYKEREHIPEHAFACVTQGSAALSLTIISPPRYYPEYAPDHYAFFCKDTEGIKLEVVCFDRPACF